LKTAVIVIGLQDGDRAVIGMCAGAELPGLRCGVERRIVNQALAADAAIDLVVKECFFEIEGQRT